MSDGGELDEMVDLMMRAGGVMPWRRDDVRRITRMIYDSGYDDGAAGRGNLEGKTPEKTA
jgi:hypothetical protein